jgi:phosphoserine phosphatase
MYQLVICDVDSTLIHQEVIDELAKKADVGAEIATITERAMLGELDFETALFERVSLLQGLDEGVLKEVAREISFNDGAQELIDYCRTKGIKIGAVSGGFIQVLNYFGLANHLDFIQANSLEISAGKLTGKVNGPIIDRARKAKFLSDTAVQYAIPISRTLAIGDGANDVDMVQLAGLGISFRGKPLLRQAADLHIESSLSEVIQYLES